MPSGWAKKKKALYKKAVQTYMAPTVFECLISAYHHRTLELYKMFDLCQSVCIPVFNVVEHLPVLPIFKLVVGLFLIDL